MRAILSQKYFGGMLLLITVAGNDRYERREADEVALSHTWAHNGMEGLPL